jgi:hypothetical protein
MGVKVSRVSTEQDFARQRSYTIYNAYCAQTFSLLQSEHLCAAFLMQTDVLWRSLLHVQGYPAPPRSYSCLPGIQSSRRGKAASSA